MIEPIEIAFNEMNAIGSQPGVKNTKSGNLFLKIFLVVTGIGVLYYAWHQINLDSRKKSNSVE